MSLLLKYLINLPPYCVSLRAALRRENMTGTVRLEIKRDSWSLNLISYFISISNIYTKHINLTVTFYIYMSNIPTLCCFHGGRQLTVMRVDRRGTIEAQELTLVEKIHCLKHGNMAAWKYLSHLIWWFFCILIYITPTLHTSLGRKWCFLSC